MYVSSFTGKDWCFIGQFVLPKDIKRFKAKVSYGCYVIGIYGTLDTTQLEPEVY